jgi:uncharacterized cupredoxin-like copper-binding protein
MDASRTNARRLLGGALALAAVAALPACGGDESEAADDADRPAVTFTADDTSIDAPDEVPSGLVDITLETAPGEVGHHIFVARLDDGVSFQEAMDDDDSFFTSMTIKGGNGTVAAGTTVRMTLDLEPGEYFVLDNPQNEESPTDQFTVVEGEPSRSKPAARGTVHLGPGMVIDLPDDFDGTGTWEFVNQDTAEVHEAAVVRLAAGATAEDLVEWFHGDLSTPMPIEGEFGSMGALGPGQRAWIELTPAEPGDYVAICFVPGRDGIPHIAKGMITPFTVG